MIVFMLSDLFYVFFLVLNNWIQSAASNIKIKFDPWLEAHANKRIKLRSIWKFTTFQSLFSGHPHQWPRLAVTTASEKTSDDPNTSVTVWLKKLKEQKQRLYDQRGSATILQQPSVCAHWTLNVFHQTERRSDFIMWCCYWERNEKTGTVTTSDYCKWRLLMSFWYKKQKS